MAKRSSFGSIMRKKLSDLTNLQVQPKLPSQDQKPPPEEALIDQLVKVQSSPAPLPLDYLLYASLLLLGPGFVSVVVVWTRKERLCSNLSRRGSILRLSCLSIFFSFLLYLVYFVFSCWLNNHLLNTFKAIELSMTSWGYWRTFRLVKEIENFK